MDGRRLTQIIGRIELLIGLLTIISLISYPLIFSVTKPRNVFLFVLISSLISIAIGIGLLKFRESARRLLLFFSAYIVFTKIMILSGLLEFTGEIITFIPKGFKDVISLIYHIAILILLNMKNMKENFIKNEART